ncbi:restriction endonuclease subunit S [Desulfovibrio sp. OttesenSCG-928-F20]|nr:restriction endonuclease subunit S [Desulfovibrio sp. OttesenSCG-928-M16]MDL2291072.1 restriction endonuclease subunit S [Desulfovibrio sp. OttesenSCG-928-F20]
MVADWKLGKIGDEIAALNAGVSVNSDSENNGKSRYFILKTSAVSKGIVDLSEIKSVTARDISRLKCPLKANSILISRMNTPDLVGECGFVCHTHNNIFLPDRIWQSTLHKDSKLNCKWLTYLLNTNKYRATIKNAATGTSNSMKNISKEQIFNIEVYYPHPTEQEAIAGVLSDADALIASLQKLITKKKAIKQGAMQELLTGKRRLPGFSGEWDNYSIDYYGQFINGNAFPKEYQNNKSGEIPFYKVSDFSNIGNSICMDKANNYIANSTASHLNCNIVKSNSTIFAKIGAAIFLERKKIAKHDCCIDNNMMAFSPNANCNPQFAWYIFQTMAFSEFASTTALPSLSGKHLGAIKKQFPTTVEEQSAIARVLSDMDTEIEQLEKKLFKYQQIKQGMMQELLTGRIRLIDAEPKQGQPAPSKKHNQQFDDAVMIAGIVDAFYSEKYPLGRKKVQKLLYLMRRKEEADVSAFLKKAAGPYADTVRYKGGEAIAKRSSYIVADTSGKGTRFSRGDKIEQALGYIQTWEKQDSIDWLVSNFQRTRIDDLELFATVDMAICDLREIHKPVSVHTIKELIGSTEEWREKLTKTYFSDLDIQRAINKCRELFEEQ